MDVIVLVSGVLRRSNRPSIRDRDGRYGESVREEKKDKGEGIKDNPAGRRQ